MMSTYGGQLLIHKEYLLTYDVVIGTSYNIVCLCGEIIGEYFRASTGLSRGEAIIIFFPVQYYAVGV